MQVSVDHMFTIGTTHAVCQDYARSGKDYVIVADGCSSSVDTDVGVRALVLAAEERLQAGENIETLEDIQQVLRHADISVRQLKQECLDATLMIARFLPEARAVQVTVWGDGLVVLCRSRQHYKGTGVGFERIVFGDGEEDSGYPVYPSYFAPWSTDRLKSVLACSPVRRIEIPWAQSEVYEQVEDKPCYTNHQYMAAHTGIVLMSDGADSFYRQTTTETGTRNEPVPAQEIVERLVDFRSVNGIFVRRQARGVLAELERENIYHADDFSMAAICLRDEG